MAQVTDPRVLLPSSAVPQPRGAAAGRTAAVVSWKTAVWYAMVGATASLLLIPVQMRLQSLPGSALDIYPHLPVVGAVFYGWAALVVALAFLPASARSAPWERLALVLVAALVFRGYWALVAPVQHQAMLHLDEANDWLRAGRILVPGHYANWPAWSGLTVGLVQMTGLSQLAAATVQTFWTTMVVAMAEYALLATLLRSSLYACLGSIAVLAGDQWLQLIYWPWTLGLLFLLACLMIFLRRGAWSGRAFIIVALVLFAAETTTHIFGVSLLFCIALAIRGIQSLRRPSAQPRIPDNLVLVMFLIVTGWLFYWAVQGLGALWREGLVQLATFAFLRLLSNLLAVSKIQVQEAYPAWANMMRLFWLLVFGAAALMWLWRFVRIRRMGSREAGLAAACAGLAMVTVPNLFLFEGGISNLRRSLTYGAFLLIPVWFSAIRRLGRLPRRIALGSIAVVLVGLAFPSFLGIGFNAPRWTVYDIELAAGRWIRSSYGPGDGLEIYTDVPVYWTLAYSLPDAAFPLPESFLDFKNYQDPGVVWKTLGRVVDEFTAGPESGTLALFVYSPKMVIYTGPIYGIPPDDPHWAGLERRASTQHAEVYDNGAVHIYANELR